MIPRLYYNRPNKRKVTTNGIHRNESSKMMNYIREPIFLDQINRKLLTDCNCMQMIARSYRICKITNELKRKKGKKRLAFENKIDTNDYAEEVESFSKRYQ